MQSDDFRPNVVLSLERVRGLLMEPPALVSLGAKIVKTDSEAPGYEASRAIDGDPSTFWHTPWEGEVPGFPHEIQIELKESVRIAGFRYLPRQDMSNGRVAAYELYVSPDGTQWGEPVAKGTFRNDTRETIIRLEKAAEGRFLRFVALSEVRGQAFASMAELDILLER